MAEIFNRRDQTRKRQQLRNQAPNAERLLWAYIRGEKCGAKFRRQVSMGAWVVDFYCPALHLVVEIDGSSHEGADAETYDTARQANIETLGVRFLRFSNAQVFDQLEAVIDTVRAEVARLQAEK